MYKDVHGRDRGHLEARGPKPYAHAYLGTGHLTSQGQSRH